MHTYNLLCFRNISFIRYHPDQVYSCKWHNLAVHLLNNELYDHHENLKSGHGMVTDQFLNMVLVNGYRWISFFHTTCSLTGDPEHDFTFLVFLCLLQHFLQCGQRIVPGYHPARGDQSLFHQADTFLKVIGMIVDQRRNDPDASSQELVRIESAFLF